MFEIISTCRPEELMRYTEMLYTQIETAEDAEKL